MFEIVLEPALCVLRKRTYCSEEQLVEASVLDCSGKKNKKFVLLEVLLG